MSCFLGINSGSDGGRPFCADDIRLWAEMFDHDGMMVEIPVDDMWVLDGWKTGWWPGAVGMDATGGEWSQAVWWDRPEITRGANGRVGFTGIVRTVYGTAVPGAVVKLFRTADDSLQSSTVSAADGTYTLSTPYADAHYIVAFLDAAVDAAGATPNTLIPG